MVNLQIIKAKKSEFNKIAKIYIDEFSKPPYNEKWTKKLILKKLNIFSKYCNLYTIFYGKEIVGFLIVDPNRWLPGKVVFFEEMAIKSNYQGRGIGKYAFNWVEAKYEKKGYRVLQFISLKTSKAYKIYKKWGYKEDEKTAFFAKKLG